MTLGFIESEHLTIIADEHRAVAGVHGPRTEITLLNMYVELSGDPPTT